MGCRRSVSDRRGMVWDRFMPDHSGNLTENRTDGCPEGTKGDLSLRSQSNLTSFTLRLCFLDLRPSDWSNAAVTAR